MDTAVNIFPMGSTYYGPTATIDSSYGTSVGLEGMVRKFKDRLTSTECATAGVPNGTLRSQRDVTCVLVRNTSGVTLYPGYGCCWDSTYIGKRVDGCSNDSWGYGIITGAAATGTLAGFVDPHVKSVRTGDLFWLVVGGPTLVRMSRTAIADVTEGNALHAATFGTSNAQTNAGATNDSGCVILAVCTNASTLIAAKQITSIIGVAITAATSQYTGGLILADIKNLLV